MFQTTPKIIKKKTWDYVRKEQKIDVEPLRKVLAEEKQRRTAQENWNKKYPKGFIFGKGFGG